MWDKKYIEKAVQEVLKEGDLFLVEVSVSRANLIKVFVDHPEGISLDECSRISRELTAHIDPEQEDYELQVSSPGIGRPLKVFPQYKKNVGKELKLTLTDGVAVKGILVSFEEGADLTSSRIEIRPQKTKKNPKPESMWIGFENIASAKEELKF